MKLFEVKVNTADGVTGYHVVADTMGNALAKVTLNEGDSLVSVAAIDTNLIV